MMEAQEDALGRHWKIPLVESLGLTDFALYLLRLTCTRVLCILVQPKLNLYIIAHLMFCRGYIPLTWIFTLQVTFSVY